MDEGDLTTQELAEIARARASFFAFLNLHFNNLPDQTFVAHIRNDPFGSALDALNQAEQGNTDLRAGASLMQSYLQTSATLDAAELSNALGVDRTRLYRGISPSYGPPPPYEAVWSATGDNVSATLQTISAIYLADGMAISPQAKERLDYIGVELDYLYQLAMREAESWQSAGENKARGLIQRQETFLREHLGQWVPAFIEKAMAMAETDFYRGHLMMVRGFLAEEQERLQALLDELNRAA